MGNVHAKQDGLAVEEIVIHVQQDIMDQVVLVIRSSFQFQNKN